jgi:hypothetical protein
MPGTNNFVNKNSSFFKYSSEPLTAVLNSVSEYMDSEYLFNKMPDISSGTWSMTSGAGSAILYPDSHDPYAIVKLESNVRYLMIAIIEANSFGVPAANSGFYKEKIELSERDSIIQSG